MPDVAGHRVLRTLGRGNRAELLLAFDDEQAVVIKRFHPTTSPSDVAHEIAALSRAAGDHVVELRDVGSEAGGTCLILERLSGGDLTTLLRMRGSLDPGEVVTVVVPIASALARMHAAGVAHGAITASSILFTADGSPTLVGFGGAELFGAGSPEVVLEAVPGVASDREALRALGVALLDRVPASEHRARELATRLRVESAERVLGVLATELFELSPPAAVRFEPDEHPGMDRLIPAVDPVAEQGLDEPTDSPQPSGRLALLAALMEQDVVARLRRALLDRWGRLAPRSRRLLLGVVAAAGVLVIALAAVPPAAPAAPAPAATASPAVAEPGSAGRPELGGDDPVAAARGLLEVRAECLRTASLLCLDGVVQAGSSAEATDRAVVRGIQDGGEAPAALEPDGLILVERLGDSALVSLGEPTPGHKEPASLLLMKGEAGWRIRDYVTGSPS